MKKFVFFSKITNQMININCSVDLAYKLTSKFLPQNSEFRPIPAV